MNRHDETAYWEASRKYDEARYHLKSARTMQQFEEAEEAVSEAKAELARLTVEAEEPRSCGRR